MRSCIYDLVRQRPAEPFLSGDMAKGVGFGIVRPRVRRRHRRSDAVLGLSVGRSNDRAGLDLLVANDMTDITIWSLNPMTW